jgi:predicted nucleotide-binding protein
LDAAFQNAQAVIALVTGDDLAQLREEFQSKNDPEYETTPTPQARPNVLFETGLAFGRHPERTIIVQIGDVRPFSDAAGRHAIRFDGSAAPLQALRDRLATAGCALKHGGTDWLTAGDFEKAISLAAHTKQLKKARGQGANKRQ